jgi:hypothetical protein
VKEATSSGAAPATAEEFVSFFVPINDNSISVALQRGGEIVAEQAELSFENQLRSSSVAATTDEATTNGISSRRNSALTTKDRNTSGPGRSTALGTVENYILVCKFFLEKSHDMTIFIMIRM